MLDVNKTREQLIKEMAEMRQRITELEALETERKRVNERLRIAEQNFHNSLDSSPLGVRIVTAEGELIYANQAILDIYGYSDIEELKAIPTKERYTPESYAEHRERAKRRNLGKPALPDYEISIVRKDGEIRYLAVFRKEVMWNGEVQFQTLYQDITERKQAEEKIAHLTLVLRAIRSVNQLIVREKDRDRLLQGACDRLIQARGYHNAWLVLLDKSGVFITTAEVGWGKDFLPVLERLKRGELTECGRRALTQSEIVVIKDPLSTCGECPLAEKCRGRGVMTVRLEHGGKGYGIVSVTVPADRAADEEEQTLFKEVTDDLALALHAIELEEERKRAEETMKESEMRFRSAAQSANDAIISADSFGNITFWNKAAQKMFGYMEEEMLGQPLTLLMSERYRDAYQKGIEQLRSTGESRLVGKTVELSGLRKDGSEFPFELSLASWEVGGGVFYTSIIRDLTERKRMQEQLMVTDRLTSIGELASGIAHELNNPLTSVIGFSDLLLGKKDLPDDIKEDLVVINREAQRTAGIVRNLLTFARKHPQEKQSVDINSIIQKVLELRAYEQKVNNIQVNTQFAPDLPEIMANSFDLQQVFINIIINAEHFMIEAHRGGTLTIATQREKDIIRVSFADDGPGISQENVGHVFDPFFTTKEVGKGTGLGLSICRGIITEHGGRIYAESELGKGATFIVELPINK